MPIRLLYLSALALSMLLCSCKKEDTVLPEQQKNIVSFLQGSHEPKLISIENVEPGSQTPFYSVSGNSVYRYIASFYNPDRPTWPQITESSVATITFRAYVFTSGTKITDNTVPYFTNDPAMLPVLTNAGLSPVVWPLEPLVIDMKGANIINGLYLALLECREGDQVEAYMTYNEAYGDTNFSVIPKNTPVVYYFVVNKVE